MAKKSDYIGVWIDNNILTEWTKDALNAGWENCVEDPEALKDYAKKKENADPDVDEECASIVYDAILDWYKDILIDRINKEYPNASVELNECEPWQDPTKEMPYAFFGEELVSTLVPQDYIDKHK